MCSVGLSHSPTGSKLMETFNAIVKKVLGLDPEKIRDDMSPTDVPDWDSMNYLLFIADLEKQYGITFTMDDVLGAKNLGDVKSLIRKKGIEL